MRKLLVLASFLAAGCGGSSSSGGGTTPLSGTFGGQTFKPTEVKAVVAGSGATACTQIPGLGTGGGLGSAGVKAIALQITSYANACGDFASSTCAFHASARTVTVAVAKLAPVIAPATNAAEPTIGPGSYTLASSLAGVVPDPTHAGWLVVAFAQATATNATCVPTTEVAQSGTLTLTDVSTTAISGHITATFANGDSLSGDFSSVPVCSETPNVCGLAQTGALCDPTGATCT